jgi:nucleotide-binding universal stress UspA family protein
MAATTHTDVFDRIFCGVDGSVQALEAARQARRLLAPDGTLELASVVSTPADPVAPHGAAAPPSTVEREAERRLGLAADVAGGAPTRLLRGHAGRRIAQELADSHATLAAVGHKGNGRTAGLLIGSVTTWLLHNAPCSVLVARHASRAFPEAIVVGSDGSDPALRAVAAARDLAERTGALLRILAAGEEASAGVLPPDVEVDDRPPLLALVEASKDVDLVVVGSRGLRGVRALGSVSERLGHEAHCSVLVVR